MRNKNLTREEANMLRVLIQDHLNSVSQVSIAIGLTSSDYVGRLEIIEEKLTRMS